MSKDKEDVTGFENESDNDFIMDDNQDKDDCKDVEPNEDTENLLKLLGIVINVGDGCEVNDSLTWNK